MCVYLCVIQSEEPFISLVQIHQIQRLLYHMHKCPSSIMEKKTDLVSSTHCLLGLYFPRKYAISPCHISTNFCFTLWSLWRYMQVMTQKCQWTPFTPVLLRKCSEVSYQLLHIRRRITKLKLLYQKNFSNLSYKEKNGFKWMWSYSAFKFTKKVYNKMK